MLSSQASAGQARLPFLSNGRQQVGSGRGYMPMQEMMPISPVYPAGQQTSLSARKVPSGENEPDIVGFLAPIFFAREGEDKAAEIHVIRIGSLRGSCSVRYRTQDASAISGQKYEHCEARLDFGPGEARRSFEVPITEDDFFDTALHFDVFLEDSVNCQIDSVSNSARVTITDEDLFPSNAFKEQIEKGDAALYDVGFSLLYAFMKFCFYHVPTIWWKSILMIALAQFGNLYYLLTIYLRVYLVDTALNIKDESTLDNLWIKGDRAKTAALIGFIWVAPNILLLAIDYIQMAYLEMGYNIRFHLRVNLFRKYLNYTQDSRNEVPIQDLKAGMMEDIPDCVSDGYLAVFDFWAMAGKLGFVAYFMLSKHPKSALPLLFFPTLIGVQLRCTFMKRLKLSAKTGDGESETVGWLVHAHNAHRLIADYKRRPFVVSRFEEVLRKQRQLVMDFKSFNFWYDQLVPWVTILFIGSYMAIAGHVVSKGYLSLGSFLATINIYKDLGDRFGKVSDNLAAMLGVIEPLAALTGCFNLPTDLPSRMECFMNRQAYVLEWLKEKGSQAPQGSVFDSIPLVLRNVVIEHSPKLSGHGGLSAVAPQGTVVHLVGPHDAGKGTILHVLCDNLKPSSGEILAPPHLRILPIPSDPLFVETLGLHGNLVFGLSDHSLHDPDPHRVRRILRRLQIDKPWVMTLFDKQAMREHSDEEKDPDDEEEENGDDEEDSTDDWITKLSSSEKKRFQLARAFVYDPEVLLMHKPVDGLDQNMKEIVLGLMREFVDKRGLENDPNEYSRRRPRTIVFSGGAGNIHPISDVVWRIQESGGVSVEHGPRRNGR